jgi:predicted HTH transcriptional regulator
MKHNEEYYKQIVYSCLNENIPTKNTFASILHMSEKYDIEQLGVLICALANYAALAEITYVYAIWGLNKGLNTIKGTDYVPFSEEELAEKLTVKVIYMMKRLFVENKNVVVLEVRSAANETIQYDGIEYILNNDLKIVRLDEVPSVEKKLWQKFEEKNCFLSKAAKSNISLEELLALLDCEKLFSLLEIPYHENYFEITTKLAELRFIVENSIGKFTITNLGALLLARDLKHFPSVEYKAVRVIIYEGSDVIAPAQEKNGHKGYMIGFEGLINYIFKSLPSVTNVDSGVEQMVYAYPRLSIRELVANALIHQDFNEKGAPTVSIFSDHIEITNPGKPLIDIKRFIDHPPVSRNESLVMAMRKAGLCESRGSGYDKVVSYIESYNLPAPVLTEYEEGTKVSLFSKRGFGLMSKDERVKACYAHTCLNYVQNKITNNTSLRKRFKLDESDRYKVSRVFTDACAEGLIHQKMGTGMKNREYVPFWAAASEI